jgi:Porin subfamily
MDRRIARAPTRRILRAVAVVATTVLAVAVAADVFAQTLGEPQSRTKSSPPRAAKSRPIARVKSCTAYGAGFVNVPGTDACIKIGGSVTTEITAGHGR